MVSVDDEEALGRRARSPPVETYPEIVHRCRCALGELWAFSDVRYECRAALQLRGGDLDWSRSREDHRQAGDKKCSKEAHSLDDVNYDGDGVALGEEGRWTGETLLHVLRNPTTALPIFLYACLCANLSQPHGPPEISEVSYHPRISS